MKLEAPVFGLRSLNTVRLQGDIVVVGGGLSGVCAAVTAARRGAKVVLIQDRPVLGGNASSEVRLWVLGATSHMGNNNRWAREGGVIDEVMVENTYRNPEGNPLIFDTVLLELVTAEPNIRLLLNTAVYEVEKHSAHRIKQVKAFNSQNSTAYEVSAPVFIDASGDGILGFLAGAAFRIGMEGRAELDEPFAPDQPSSELLGHTIYFYSKDTGRPVKYHPPQFALRDITNIPRWRDIRLRDSGCRLWWLEWGGALDTIHQCEEIKWELWRVAYGVWHHIKNSGQFPEAENYTLEWVGLIPGKRESRRFEGDYMIRQQDIIGQSTHYDAVSFGGWAIDLHPVDGVYSPQPGCQQWHSKGVYQIPYRALYSRNIENLLLAGRIISASHIAFGSTRVMATCAHNAQAAGMAAAICSAEKLCPRDLLASDRLRQLQQELLRIGQYIPGVVHQDSDDLAAQAAISASSELRLSTLVAGTDRLTLDTPWAMMLPVKAGKMPAVTFLANVTAATTITLELRTSSLVGNHTPDVTLERLELHLEPGDRYSLVARFNAIIDQPRYVFVCLMENPQVALYLSEQRVTGVLALARKYNRSVAKSPRQEPPPGSGIESFEFWLPQRRPLGKNLAVQIDPPLDVFPVRNVVNGVSRPTNQPNAWVAEFADSRPVIRLTWNQEHWIQTIELTFDTDFDHPMETVLMGHPERVMPFCVQQLSVVIPAHAKGNADDTVLFSTTSHHQSRLVIRLTSPVQTNLIEIRLAAPDPNFPAALFDLRCYAQTA